ncbi:uncharacterized protein TrAtP1_012450 [Trichoderma atroviride]|uniref:uncharacterized protein n=1 Tax=Hypocrea atroviridis TaxID=63577 RepID=UPI003322EB59|nr:hypothetical protein TrAtP1_012450 [Trichoderma atroviride]
MEATRGAIAIRSSASSGLSMTSSSIGTQPRLIQAHWPQQRCGIASLCRHLSAINALALRASSDMRGRLSASQDDDNDAAGQNGAAQSSHEDLSPSPSLIMVL